MENLNIIKLNKDEKLSLSHENLTLFWIGAGSAFSKINYQTNLIIIKNNTHILVDCGSRSPTALVEYGCPITSIENYIITHSHADHIGGMEEAALLNRYITKKKPNIIITEDYEEILWHFSLKGGCAFNERINGEILSFNDFFNPLRPKKIFDKPRIIYDINIENINIKLFRTKHIPDSAKSWHDSYISFGIIIDERIIFTADTRYDPDLIEELLTKYKNIECIFHDCQFFKGGVHASYEELMTHPENIKKMMFLTHYGDNYNDYKPIEDGFAGFVEQGSYYHFK